MYFGCWFAIFESGYLTADTPLNVLHASGVSSRTGVGAFLDCLGVQVERSNQAITILQSDRRNEDFETTIGPHGDQKAVETNCLNYKSVRRPNP